MEINVTNMKTELEKLNNIMGEYYSNLLNINKSIDSVSFFWMGGRSSDFFDSHNLLEKKSKMNYIEIGDLLKIYNDIVREYSKIGNKIKYNKDMKDKMKSAINRLKSKNSKIINSYNNINYSGIDSQIISKLESEKNKIVKINRSLDKYSDQINTLFNNIEDIEQKIGNKLYKFQYTLEKRG